VRGDGQKLHRRPGLRVSWHVIAKPDGMADRVNAALVRGQAEGEGRPKGGPAKRDAVTSEARRHRYIAFLPGEIRLKAGPYPIRPHNHLRT
jgi:hypothetical protein